MALFAHLADTHLGYAQYRLTEREEDIYELLKLAYERAIAERVNAIVISGDVFHVPRPPNRALLTLYKLASAAGERGVKTIVVAGEHDQLKRRGDVHPLLMLSQLSSDIVFVGGIDLEGIVGSKYSLELNGKKYHFLGVNALPRIVDRKEKYKGLFRQLEVYSGKEEGKKVLVAHLPVEGLMSDNIEPSVPIADLPGGFHYYALGHLHIRHIRRTEKGGLLGYPGSLDILSRQEIKDWEYNGKGFFLVDLSSEEATAEKVNLDVRPQFLIEGEKAAVLKKLTEVLGVPYQKKPMVHIRVRLGKNEEREFREAIGKLLEDKTLDYRLEIHKENIKLGGVFLPEGGLGEAEIISRIYNIDKSAALALIRLKDCLSSRSQPEECENEVNDVLSYREAILRITEG